MGSITYYYLSVYHHRKRKGIRIMVRYAVWIEKDTNEYDYVRERNGIYWSDDSPVLLFDNKNDAEIEAHKWNTGTVVEYVINK